MEHIYRITARGAQISKSVNAPNDENWRTLRLIARLGLATDEQASQGTGLPEGTVRVVAGRLKRQGLIEEG